MRKLLSLIALAGCFLLFCACSSGGQRDETEGSHSSWCYTVNSCSGDLLHQSADGKIIYTSVKDH